MAERDIQSVSATTGQFPALSGVALANGNKSPDSGKGLPEKQVDMPDLEKLAEKLTAASRNAGRDLRFEVDLNSNRAVISVLDRETGEIIRQIPPEKAEIYLSNDGSLAMRLFDASV
ncbi:MAG: flagellar protein FlaG [Pseudomonadota bacterium]